MGAVVLVLVTTLSGCLSEAKQSDPVPLPIPTTQGMPSSPKLDDVLAAGHQLGGLRGHLVANCMAMAGYPEPLRAVGMSVDLPAAYVSTATHIVPIDLGPSTEADARAYGYAGTTFPINAGGGSGIIISRDPNFDMQADRCQKRLDAELPNLSPIQSKAAALSNRVREDFVRHASIRLRDDLLSRFRCVQRRGYPRLDPHRALQQEPLQLLRSMSVNPGREVDIYEQPTEADVAAGSVGVFPPDPPRSYQPSWSEEKFALTYVRCGREQRFADALQSVEADAKDYVSRKYHYAARRLYRALVRLGGDMRPSSFSGGN